MAKDIIFIIEGEDVFIDESGKTSLEPEGAGHHHPDWDQGTSALDESAEEAFDSDGGFERGRRPVEGDGGGSPD